jgi:calcium-dependent protein kinase
MDHLKVKRNYQERDAADIARALITTIAYCHQNSVVHRDLKLENLLMSDATKHAVLKVTDFGLSTFLVSDTEVLRDHVGSAWYIAPEVLRGAYSKQADIWSCGVILYLLLSGAPPFDGASEEEVYWAIRYNPPDTSGGVWRKISDMARDCVLRMLVRGHAAKHGLSLHV